MEALRTFSHERMPPLHSAVADQSFSRRPAVAVVVVSYENLELLARCLEAVAEQSRPPDRLIVVDNGSSEECVQWLDERPSAIEVIRLDRNRGFAAAANIGAQAASGCDWVAFLNNDAFPHPLWLERTLSAMRLLPDCYAAFSPKILQEGDRSLLDGAGDRYHSSGFAWKIFHGRPVSRYGRMSREVFSCSASACLYRRSTFLSLGGFDEDFFCYFEDVDLGFRLRLIGAKACYVSEAVVFHVGSASTARKSAFALYHAHRNMVWAFFKNMPTPLLLLYLPQHMLFSVLSALWYWLRGQGDVVTRAKRDALRGGMLFKMARKRKAIQAQRTISALSLRRSLSLGWFRPYLRRYD